MTTNLLPSINNEPGSIPQPYPRDDGDGPAGGTPAASDTHFASDEFSISTLEKEGLGVAALPETVYFSRGRVAMARLLAVIRRRPAACSIQDARGDQPASVQGELRLQGVTFAYPSRPELPVLKWRARSHQAAPACVHGIVLCSCMCPHSIFHVCALRVYGLQNLDGCCLPSSMTSVYQLWLRQLRGVHDYSLQTSVLY